MDDTLKLLVPVDEKVWGVINVTGKAVIAH
jgi:hypothetical protein